MGAQLAQDSRSSFSGSLGHACQLFLAGQWLRVTLGYPFDYRSQSTVISAQIMCSARARDGVLAGRSPVFSEEPARRNLCTLLEAFW